MIWDHEDGISEFPARTSARGKRNGAVTTSTPGVGGSPVDIDKQALAAEAAGAP